ncbi:hybrid sensor histidine kinase/response regulator [Noviherbaspirillum pedocola]|uniref:histidine kinase n=1 Tax=Noviherbaspirillum pedocola TaxID=2801341 RepID=A0A934W729_9BURK|nr:ATP-binding protein [Noviherbaspirillum pedocola]MBK4736917.1 response regulator [Noviherbaspirillum pedocola]
MRLDRFLSGSLARRFALVSAALAGAALLLTLLASWWLVTQQHQAGLRELRVKEAGFHASAVGSSLRSLAARMSEVAGSAILANGLVDSAGRETYLQPYLDGAREVDGIHVELMVSDFESAPIASSAGANFSRRQLEWMRRLMERDEEGAAVFDGPSGPQLVGLKLLRYSRTKSAEGALLYKTPLAEIEPDRTFHIAAAQRPQPPDDRTWPIPVPADYQDLHLQLVRDVIPPTDYGALLPHYALILVIAAALAAAVLLLGARLALLLTSDLRHLELFASNVVREGFGLRRAAIQGSGEVAGLAVAINHMLDRLNQQHALLQAESEKFHQLANTIPQLAWSAHADGTADWFNERWYAYTGTRRADMVNDGWSKLVAPEERDAVLTQWREGVAAGAPITMTFSLRGADGIYRRFFTQVAPLKSASGRIVQWFGTNTDVTPLELAEQAARESGRRLREALLAANMAAWNWDLESGRAEFSDNAPSVFGDAYVAGNNWDFLSAEDRTRLVGMATEAAACQDSFRCEVELPGEDGQPRWFEIRGRSAGRASMPRGMSGVALDVSERRRAENALLQADQRKDEFLAMLAHELRNPLAPISSAVKIMELLIPDPAPPVQKAREVIDRQTRHLSRLVDDLLDVSRISTGKIVLRGEQVDAATMVSRAIEMNRPLLDARGHQLITHGLDRHETLHGDPTRLTQIIGNLINNAAKYTEAGGIITVALEREREWVLIRVADNGIGISPQVLPHVFNLFLQAERSLDRSLGGLGIGLSVVQRLTELHGGQVEAKSAGERQGSEFIVRLPAVDGHGDVAGSAPKSAAASRSARRILVVDDNRDAVDSLAMMLKLSGNDVEVAYEGESALRIAQSFRPDAVVLDIGLPGMDGYEVARRLRRLPETAGALVVAVTGYGQKEDRERAHAAGFDHHLVKPIEADMLLSLLSLSRTA